MISSTPGATATASRLKNIASAVMGTVDELNYPFGPRHGHAKEI